MSKKRNLDEIFSIRLTQSWKKVLGTLSILWRNYMQSFTWSGKWRISCLEINRTSTAMILVFPPPHVTMLEHFRKLLKTFAFLNIARGEGLQIFCSWHDTVPRLFATIVCLVSILLHLNLLFVLYLKIGKWYQVLVAHDILVDVVLLNYYKIEGISIGLFREWLSKASLMPSYIGQMKTYFNSRPIITPCCVFLLYDHIIPRTVVHIEFYFNT